MPWKLLLVLIVSMIPLIELRGAIPVAIGLDLGLPEWLVLVTAIIGNILPVPLIFLFAQKFLRWGSQTRLFASKKSTPVKSSQKSPSKTPAPVNSPSKSTPTNPVRVKALPSAAANPSAKSAPAKPTPLNKFCTFCLKKGEKAGRKLLQKTGNSVYLALFLFVAIPVPGTGAWTGTLAASLLGLDRRKTVLAISLGVLVAGLIMLAVSLGLFQALFR